MKYRISKWLSAGLCLAFLITAFSGCGSPSGTSEPGTDSPGGGSQDERVEPSGGSGDLPSEAVEPADNGEDLPAGAAVAFPLSAADNKTYTDFAVRLFQKSMGETKNTLISPLSVINALAMTANGAEGETLAQMERLFGADISSLSEYLRDFNQTLPDEKDCKLHLANSIWYRDEPSFSVKEDFIRQNTDFFHAEVCPSAFDAAALQEINRWVSDHTDGMIPRIVDEIEEDTVMYLINALAFDALWLEPYQEYQLEEDYFIPETQTARPSDSQQFPGILVQMMRSRESVLLRDMDDQGHTAALGFLKYYTGGKYALATLLPEEGTSVEDYVNSLSGEKIRRILTDTSAADINAGLPKFETEYSVSMKDVLRNMGMTDVFDPNNADLSGIGSVTDGSLYVDDVIHKTYISVDSSGTRAGAATAVIIMKESALLERNPIDIILNRPFVYMIVDCENMIPVFIGVLETPGLQS